MEIPANLLTEWSRLLVGALRRAGVRDAIVSPGSRSTPLAWALLNEPDITCHSVLDERSAAFFALGLSRTSAHPPLLVCTSGSAGAHYYPAVIEASESALPLLILTADRPTELTDCAAAQTINQTELFGRFTRGFFALGDPTVERDGFAALSRKATQAFALTQGAHPGPVHLNFPARKPLEPAPARTETERELQAWVDARLERTAHVHPARLEPSALGVERFRTALTAARRPLIVLGAADPETARLVTELSRAETAPLLAETAAQAPEAANIELLLHQFGPELPHPDLILQFGRPLTSSQWGRHLAQWGAPHLQISPHGFPDPHHSVQELLHSPLASAARALHPGALHLERDLDFTLAWSRAQTRTVERIRASLQASPTSELLSEPHAVFQVLSALPSKSQLLLGNSLPLRLGDALGPLAFQGRGWPRVHVQRGTNGIDGLIAGGAGIAHASHEPTLALLGDVTTAHDLSSLAVARAVRVPYCIVVLDNAGGRIFDQLPLAARSAELEEKWRFWTTPPRLDFEAAARAYGIRFARATDPARLPEIIGAALREPETTLVHLPTDPESSTSWLRQFGARHHE